MAEEAVEGEHFGVVAAAVDLEVGATGEGRADAQDQFAGAGGGDGDVLDAKVFLAAKDGGSHGPVLGIAVIDLICGGGHPPIFSSPGLSGRGGGSRDQSWGDLHLIP